MNDVEIELKLVLTEESLKKFLQLPLLIKALRAGSKKGRQLSSSYYDTENMVLREHGIAYRVRDKGDGTYEATVKTGKARQGGLTKRTEINIPLEVPTPVLQGFAARGLGYDLTELAPKGVNCLFTVNVERITYLLDYKNAVIELAIDKGYIVSAKDASKTTPIDEVELELKEGTTEVLMEFAELVKREIPVREESKSKFVRGLELCGIRDTKL